MVDLSLTFPEGLFPRSSWFKYSERNTETMARKISPGNNNNNNNNKKKK